MTGSLLYYAHAIDGNMSPALNTICTGQATHTKKSLDKYKVMLDYTAIYPSTFIIYHASDVVLYVNSDTAYLVMPKIRSRKVVYYHYSDHLKRTTLPNFNVPLFIESKTMQMVVTSAAQT